MSTEGGLNTPKDGGAHEKKYDKIWAVKNTNTLKDLNVRNFTVGKQSETSLLIQNESVVTNGSRAETFCLADPYDTIDAVENVVSNVQNIRNAFIEPIGDTVLTDGEWLNHSKMCIEMDAKGDATHSNMSTSAIEMADRDAISINSVDNNASLQLGLTSELFEESDISFPLSRTSSHDSTINPCNITDTHNFETTKVDDDSTDTVAENVVTEIMTDVNIIPVNTQKSAEPESLSLLEMDSSRKPVLMSIGSSYLERSKSILDDLETLDATAHSDKDVYIVTDLQGIPVDFNSMPEPDRNNLLMMPQELEKLSDECLDCLDTLDDLPLHDQPKLYNLSGNSLTHNDNPSFIDECSNGSKIGMVRLGSSATETQMHSISLIGNHAETNVESDNSVIPNSKSTMIEQIPMSSNVSGSLTNMVHVSKILSDEIQYDGSMTLNSSAVSTSEDQLVNTSSLVASSNSVATFPIRRASMPDTSIETTNTTRATVAATISIKTNKFHKSTQITVNTPRGQQCYDLNIDELLQANTMLLAMPPKPGLNADGTQQTQGTSQPQIGYLLVPVDKYGHVKQQASVKDVIPAKETSDSSDTLQRPSRRRGPCVCHEPGCGKEFPRHAKLLIHQMSHSGERPHECSVPGCRWAFSTLYKLRRHEETHEGRKDYVCDHPGCSLCFTTIYNLKTHKKLHERELTENCPIEGCGESFDTKRKLDRHMKTHHPSFRRSYKCPHEGCNKVFSSSTSMGSHARVHAPQRMDLTCQFEGCGRTFQRLFMLKEHSRTHTGIRPYVCILEGCGMGFVSASKLRRHMNKHTGTRKFLCPVEGCGKAFMRNDHLKGHLLTHSGERPFACHFEACTARFNAKCSLYTHIKKHNQGAMNQYLCPMDNCTKKYSTKACLRNHIHKHYLNISNADSRAESSSNFDFLLGGTEDMSNTSLEDIKPSAGLQEQRCIPEGLSPDVMSQLSPSLVTQLIASSELSRNSAQVIGVPISMENHVPMVTILPSNQISIPQLSGQVSLISGLPVISEATSLPDSTLISVTAALENDQALAAVVDAETHVLQENHYGSARTDYRSNHMMMDRVKKKRQLLRDRSLSMGDLTSSLTGLPLVEPGSLALSLLHPTSDGTSFTGLVDLPAPPTIMFRCPLTGTIFTQTQLLQDDPPSVELFADSVTLSSELAALQSTPADNAMTTQFTGTTINLQDLE